MAKSDRAIIEPPEPSALSPDEAIENTTLQDALRVAVLLEKIAALKIIDGSVKYRWFSFLLDGETYTNLEQAARLAALLDRWGLVKDGPIRAEAEWKEVLIREFEIPPQGSPETPFVPKEAAYRQVGALMLALDRENFTLGLTHDKTLPQLLDLMEVDATIYRRSDLTDQVLVSVGAEKRQPSNFGIPLTPEERRILEEHWGKLSKGLPPGVTLDASIRVLSYNAGEEGQVKWETIPLADFTLTYPAPLAQAVAGFIEGVYDVFPENKIVLQAGLPVVIEGKQYFSTRLRVEMNLFNLAHAAKNSEVEEEVEAAEEEAYDPDSDEICYAFDYLAERAKCAPRFDIEEKEIICAFGEASPATLLCAARLAHQCSRYGLIAPLPPALQTAEMIARDAADVMGLDAARPLQSYLFGNARLAYAENGELVLRILTPDRAAVMTLLERVTGELEHRAILRETSLNESLPVEIPLLPEDRMTGEEVRKSVHFHNGFVVQELEKRCLGRISELAARITGEALTLEKESRYHYDSGYAQYMPTLEITLRGGNEKSLILLGEVITGNCGEECSRYFTGSDEKGDFIQMDITLPPMELLKLLDTERNTGDVPGLLHAKNARPGLSH